MCTFLGGGRRGEQQNQHSSLQYILKCIAVATYIVWYGSVLLRCLHFLTALFEIVLCMKMFNSSDCQKDITLLHLCVLYNNNVKLRFYIPEFWIFHGFTHFVWSRHIANTMFPDLCNFRWSPHKLKIGVLL